MERARIETERSSRKFWAHLLMPVLAFGQERHFRRSRRTSTILCCGELLILGKSGIRHTQDEYDRSRSALPQTPAHPPPDDLLLATPASPLVNSVKNEGPELLHV